MSTDLEPRHFSSPLAIFFVLNSEEKHISHISKNIFIKMCENVFFGRGLWRMLMISVFGWLPGYSDRIFFFNCTNNLLPPFFKKRKKTKHKNLTTFLYNIKQCD